MLALAALMCCSPVQPQYFLSPAVACLCWPPQQLSPTCSRTAWCTADGRLVAATAKGTLACCRADAQSSQRLPWPPQRIAQPQPGTSEPPPPVTPHARCVMQPGAGLQLCVWQA